MSQYYIKNGDNYEEATAFSQEELDGIIAKRLERERANHSDYDDLKAKVENYQTMSSEYETKLADLTTVNKQLEDKLAAEVLNTERVKVIHDFGIKSELEEFITGSTVEEMRARAEKLAHTTVSGAVSIDKEHKPEPKDTWQSNAAKALFGSQE